ncbi:MAG: FAD-binding and (Fe-S)-binding domain-containing protein [Pyrinomonadaceae bacterium]
MLPSEAENYIEKLREILPKRRVKSRLIDRYAYAPDASHFYLVPRAVIQPKTVAEIQAVLNFSQREKIHITFRAAGTSLSGQGITDGILVDLSNYWRKVNVEENGAAIRLEPGVIGALANTALHKYGRKIGPDPASIGAAMIGGILANNSSGMCCGVSQNSYHTMRSIKFVLPNGSIFDSGVEEDKVRFEFEVNEIYAGLAVLRDEIRGNSELSNLIRRKYLQKNTVGYCLNAFLDFEHPLDIFAHLLIGSEGTLAFIAEAVLNTLPDLPFKATGMLYFESPQSACNAISQLKESGAAALEFMDRASLRSIEDEPGMPSFIKDLPSNASAILVEYQEETAQRLADTIKFAKPVFEFLPLILSPSLTENAAEQALLWKVRKGMYPSVAGMRARGTSALLEDFTLPVERLGEAVSDIQMLFAKFKFDDGIIFGHAKDGNLHFVVSQSFADKEEIAHYKRFNDELFKLVLEKYDGALKGEHSTGRAVTPFVKTEWGSDAYGIMKRLKLLIDPLRLLNPDVIISDDPDIYHKNLKSMPVADVAFDSCIECGFCEPVCPSRDYTLTPRRRIIIRRAMARLDAQKKFGDLRRLKEAFEFDGLETCAADGMCATTCPVGINTGDIVKKLRAVENSEFENRATVLAAKNFKAFEATLRLAVRVGLAANSLLGRRLMKNLTGFGRRIVKDVPLWSNSIEKPPNLRKRASLEVSIIYFTSCTTRMMGGDLIGTFTSLCEKAGIGFNFISDPHAACCGQLFSSKGFEEASEIAVNSTVSMLYEASEGGRIPIVLDVTSCTQTLMNSRAQLTEENKTYFDKLKIVDVIEFAADILLPNLSITKRKLRVAFHPTCAATRMNLTEKLRSIGEACANEVVIPEAANCCGMAGDRGFYYPELTRSATKRELEELSKIGFDGYYSSAKTCEIALSDASGNNYESILKLLDDVTALEV